MKLLIAHHKLQSERQQWMVSVDPVPSHGIRTKVKARGFCFEFGNVVPSFTFSQTRSAKSTLTPTIISNENGSTEN